DAFGVGNLDTIKHLGLIMRKAVAVDHRGWSTYVEHPERLRIPIHFLVGDRNYMFFPATTDLTLRWLKEHNDPSLYTYKELPGYAHLDCFIGRDAAADVFPDIIEFLDRTQARRATAAPKSGASGEAVVARSHEG